MCTGCCELHEHIAFPAAAISIQVWKQLMGGDCLVGWVFPCFYILFSLLPAYAAPSGDCSSLIAVVVVRSILSWAIL